MSAWLVFTAMGFYPVTPGTNEYVLGRPFLDRATLNLPSGKRFTVIARGLSAANRYVASVRLNGQPLRRSFIRHDEIIGGGTLEFRMAAKPDRTWAIDRLDRPYSMSR